MDFRRDNDGANTVFASLRVAQHEKGEGRLRHFSQTVQANAEEMLCGHATPCQGRPTNVQTFPKKTKPCLSVLASIDSKSSARNP